MKTIFFGGSKYVTPIIEVLKNKFELLLVITSDKNLSDPVPLFCTKNKIEWISAANLSDNLVNKIKNTNSEFAVLADFGLILPQEFLNIFPKGILNIHPSLLPKYRGPTPVQTAILNGDKTTGVSLIKLDNQVDHGPIVSQKEELIKENDTAENLYLRLFELGAKLFSEKIDDYLSGKINLKKQNDLKATYTKVLTREDGYFDFSLLEIRNLKLEIARKIRAYYPWPGAWGELMINDKLLRIKFLPEDKIQVEGKKPMSYKDFVNGYSQGKEILKKMSLA